MIKHLRKENGNLPAFIAADMMSQAEHGTGFEASTTFCLSETQAKKIKEEIIRLCKENNLVDATKESLKNYGDIFVVNSKSATTSSTGGLPTAL